MKCSTVLVCMLCSTYMYTQSSVNSWAGNVVNVGVNCPIVVGDFCPPWNNPSNAQNPPDEIFSTNNLVLASIGTDSLRATGFNFGGADPLIDLQNIIGGRVHILLDQDVLLLNLNLADNSEIFLRYTNAGNPGLNRSFTLDAGSLVDINLLGIDLSLLSAEASSGDLAGLTVSDVKNGNWHLNFRLDGITVSIITTLRVDAIELEFDYETPLFLDLVRQDYTLQKDHLSIRWQLSEQTDHTDFFVEQLNGKNWKYMALLENNRDILEYEDREYHQNTSYFRLCAANLSGNRKCFDPLVVRNSNVAVNIYPNPVNQKGTLWISEVQSVHKVEALTINGLTLDLNFKVQSKLCEIDTHKLPAGLVVVRLYETPEIISHHRLLVLQ